MQQTMDKFVEELQNPTSLPFIKHTLSTNPIVNTDDLFETLVVGGSVYQNALMKKIDGPNQFVLCRHGDGHQPRFDTDQDLFQFLETIIDKETSVVALNFAYPLQPVQNKWGLLDGKLQNGTKENTFAGLVGETVGEKIAEYFYKTRKQELRVSVANDTICLLLSGLMTHSWDKLAAGIVGTGMNFAIFLDQNTAVNLEAANFNQFEQSESGKYVDERSNKPGTSLFEKEVSGAYLYQHMNYFIEKNNLPVDPIDNTKLLDRLVYHPDKHVSETAKKLLKHSAELVATQIAGILQFSKKNLIFIMQGSLFWKGENYKEMVENEVIRLCPDYKAAYEKVLHSDLYGAAKLVA